MGNNYKSILFALALISPLFMVANVEANPVRQYMEIDRADLKLLIGEKLYNQPGDGCWSCHGAEGIKADGVSDEIAKKHQNSSPDSPDKKNKKNGILLINLLQTAQVMGLSL